MRKVRSDSDVDAERRAGERLAFFDDGDAREGAESCVEALAQRWLADELCELRGGQVKEAVERDVDALGASQFRKAQFRYG